MPRSSQSGLLGRGHQSFGHPRFGDIAGDDGDFGPALQFGENSALLVGRFAATVEHDAARTAVDEPSGDDQTEPAETTGDDVRGTGADRRAAF